MAMIRRIAQLELQLDDVRKVVAWQGTSPRALTRAAQAFSLVREGMGRLDLDASDVGEVNQRSSIQLDLFPLAGGTYGSQGIRSSNP